MAEEHNRYQRGDFGQLHHARDDLRRQQRQVRRGGEQHGRQRDQQCRHTHGEQRCDGAFHHHATGQPDSDGGSDGHLHGGSDRHRALELRLEEKRHGHIGGHGSELHHSGHHLLGQ